MTARRRGPRYWTVRALLRGARALRAVAAHLDPPPSVRDRALAAAAVIPGPWPAAAPMDALSAAAVSRAVHPSSWHRPGYRMGPGQVVMGPQQPRPRVQDRIPSAPPRGRRVPGYATDDPPAL